MLTVTFWPADMSGRLQLTAPAFRVPPQQAETKVMLAGRVSTMLIWAL
jgi:hypothetical protein